MLHKDVRGTDGVFGWHCIILLFSQLTLCDLYTPINPSGLKTTPSRPLVYCIKTLSTPT